jgi:Cu/Ag efflux pump CusA
MSGVLIVSDINRRRRNWNAREGRRHSGALAQMRPVLMMVVVAMLGMVPAARATGVGSDIQRLATVVGGLLSTLVLTPSRAGALLVDRVQAKERSVNVTAAFVSGLTSTGSGERTAD